MRPYSAVMTTFTKLTIAALALTAHAAAGIDSDNLLTGQKVRIVTKAGVSCTGKLISWAPQERTVEFQTKDACGATDGILIFSLSEMQHLITLPLH